MKNVIIALVLAIAIFGLTQITEAKVTPIDDGLGGGGDSEDQDQMPLEVLEIIIVSPEDKTYNTSDIELEVTTNKNADITYKLDSENETSGCTNCTEFTTTLTDLENGNHIVRIYATTLTESVEASIDFDIDVEEAEPEEGNFTEPRFAIGFQKLPKEFAAGELTEEELLEILENNKLNPGVINRLIKTVKLSEELVDKILETQFLPVGIWHKLLWGFGFGHNKLVENLNKYYNLTDEQLTKALKKQPLPPGTIKKFAIEQELTSEQIDTILENQKLHKNTLRFLVRTQELSQENIENILEKREQDLDKEQRNQLREQVREEIEEKGKERNKTNSNKGLALGKQKKGN